MAASGPDACLLGIPTELRLHILELFVNEVADQHLAYRDNFTLELDIRDEVFYEHDFRQQNDAFAQQNLSSVLRINKQIYNETMDLLYSRINVKVRICGAGNPVYPNLNRMIGPPGDIKLWRYVKNLDLHIDFTAYGATDAALEWRLEEFVLVWIDHGKNLKTLNVNLDKDECHGNGVFIDAMNTLVWFTVKGKVKVNIFLHRLRPAYIWESLDYEEYSDWLEKTIMDPEHPLEAGKYQEQPGFVSNMSS